MTIHGPKADPQQLGDLLARVTIGDAGEHLTFPSREVRCIARNVLSAGAPAIGRVFVHDGNVSSIPE